MKTVKKIPSVHIPIQKPDGSMEWVWYMFLQWLAEHLEDTDLSDYFTKEEINEMLSGYYTKTETDDILSDYAIDSNVVHKTGAETIAGTKTFTYSARLAAGTTFTKQGGQPSIEGGELHFEKGDSDTTISDYVVEDLYGGKVRFFGTCNKSGGGTEIRHPLAVDFTNNRISTPSVYLNNVPVNDTGTSSHFVPTVGWVNNATAGVNNLVHKTGAETIAGYKTFVDPTTVGYFTVKPPTDSPTSTEGGEISFVGASGEVNAGKLMFIDRHNGKLRLFGYDSGGTVHVQLEADAEHNTLYGVAPTEDTTNSVQIDTVGARNTKLQSYQPLLTAGSNISISGNTISATDTTYSVMTGATSSAAGTSGLVPAPASGDNDKFLKGDGTWGAVTGSNYHPDLFDTKWADHQVNDVQWLRADTFSWQNGAVYEAAYQHLTDDCEVAYAYKNSDNTLCWLRTRTPQVGDSVYGNWQYTTDPTTTIAAYDESTQTITLGGWWPSGESKTFTRYPSADKLGVMSSETIGGTTILFYLADDGHKICPASEESNVVAIYNATGVAWYYVLDTTNERFKLPRTQFGFTGLRDTVGNYVPETLPSINVKTTGTGNNNNLYHASALLSNNGSLARGTTGDNAIVQTLKTSGSTVYQDNAPVQPPATQMYLYFYVGEFTQTALENTAGITAETLNDKVDKGHEVIEFQAPTAANNYTWYRLYADGWVEQGGNYDAGSYSTSITANITYPIEMADTRYTKLFGCEKDSDSGWAGYLNYTNPTTTGVTFRYWNNSSSSVRYISWQIAGMAA